MCTFGIRSSLSAHEQINGAKPLTPVTRTIARRKVVNQSFGLHTTEKTIFPVHMVGALAELTLVGYHNDYLLVVVLS
jgi:hypothetical protein